MADSFTGKGSRAGQRAWWAGLAACGLMTSIGCQAEHGGMTLPSGKYLMDDVQYFAPGPDFPLANTLAAQQRARMIAQGIDPIGGATLAPPAPGTVLPTTGAGMRPDAPPPGVVAPAGGVVPGRVPGTEGMGNAPAGEGAGDDAPPDVPPPGF
jgi:hypothetical protein